MSIETQQIGKTKLDIKKNRKSSRRLRLTLTIVIAIIFALFITVAQVLGNLQIISGVWAVISSAIAGVSGTLFAFLPLIPLIFPSEQQSQQITHVPVPVIVSGGTAHISSTTTQLVEGTETQLHHIIIQPHVPSMLQAPERKTAFRGIVGFLPL